MLAVRPGGAALIAAALLSVSLVAPAFPASLATPAAAETLRADMVFQTFEGPALSQGTITLEDGPYGLIVTPDMVGMDVGIHAMHVHENSSCHPTIGERGVVPAGGAGDHFDPHGTGRHEGPYGEGHLGDLPNLLVEADGSASIPVLAPRLTTADIKGRALVLSFGADRYGTEPSDDNGAAADGGEEPRYPRLYCGVIE